jgi:hypothetical protein
MYMTSLVNAVPRASPCFSFTHTYYNIASTRNGFCEPEGFYSNSLLMHMHVLNKTAWSLFARTSDNYGAACIMVFKMHWMLATFSETTLGRRWFFRCHSRAVSVPWVNCTRMPWLGFRVKLYVKIRIDECAWLCGGIIFFFEIRYWWIRCWVSSFFQQNVGKHCFITSVA